jgi:hypothetical protein
MSKCEILFIKRRKDGAGIFPRRHLTKTDTRPKRKKQTIVFYVVTLLIRTPVTKTDTKPKNKTKNFDSNLLSVIIRGVLINSVTT